jgi:hypothetical protein
MNFFTELSNAVQGWSDVNGSSVENDDTYEGLKNFIDILERKYEIYHNSTDQFASVHYAFAAVGAFVLAVEDNGDGFSFLVNSDLCNHYTTMFVQLSNEATGKVEQKLVPVTSDPKDFGGFLGASLLRASELFSGQEIMDPKKKYMVISMKSTHPDFKDKLLCENIAYHICKNAVSNAPDKIDLGLTVEELAVPEKDTRTNKEKNKATVEKIRSHVLGHDMGAEGRAYIGILAVPIPVPGTTLTYAQTEGSWYYGKADDSEKVSIFA